MRLTSYKVRAAEGDSEDAEMGVSQAGGSKRDNIRRWEGQFSNAGETKVEERTSNGVSVTVVQIHGTFVAKGGGPMMARSAGEPKPDWTMLVAMAHTAPHAYFFKLTGPSQTVAAAQEAFDALVGSIRPTG